MSSIPLDPGKGLDPHVINCAACGENYGVSLGALRQATDYEGNIHYAQKGKTRQYPHPVNSDWAPVTDREITMGLCTACEENILEMGKAVQEGGIHFKCRSCDKTGVIRGTSELAQLVRKQMNIHAPEPCGVEFDTCEEHTPNGSINS